MAAITITWADLTASELRAASGRTKDARGARRMLAIALVLEGVDRATAAATCGMDRQTLRDWVHRYNADGLADLVNRARPARRRQLSPVQMAERADWVEAGADPERDGVVRWRRQDLQRRIAAAFGVAVHERSVGKRLAALAYRRLSARTRHPKADLAAQDAFKKKASARRYRRRSPNRPGASRWRSGSRTRLGWASRARSPGSGRGTGPGRPRRATPGTNGTTSSARSAKGAASPPASSCLRRHRRDERPPRRDRPHRRPWRPRRARARRPPAGAAARTWRPPPTSRCSPRRPTPELNPVENVWQHLRANKLAISVFSGYDAVVVGALPQLRNRQLDPAGPRVPVAFAGTRCAGSRAPASARAWRRRSRHPLPSP